jgi:membrane-associated phospholipid phosphatase
LFLSITAIAVNFFCYQYAGNNYFPPHASYMLLALALMYIGFLLQFGRSSHIVAILKETIYFFLVMSLLALATNATQYTPFPIIDKHILTFEKSLGINIESIIAWTQTKPLFKKILEYIYDTLPYQMAYIPLLVIATKKWHVIREYYFLFMFSALLGFTFYYFYPTTAPASIIHSPYFSESQRATGLKFLQIHQHQQPTTLDGGLIALPSFHVIWAWLCLYLLKCWPIAFIIMLPVNLLLIASCVLLGWHYPLDVLGGIIVIIFSHGVYTFIVARMERSRMLE